MATMNVSLPDAMREWIDERVRSGRYGNASEYVRALIREDQENDEKRRVIVQMLEEGEEDFRQGRYIELNNREEQKKFFDDIVEGAIREAAQPLAAGKKTIR